MGRGWALVCTSLLSAVACGGRSALELPDALTLGGAPAGGAGGAGQMAGASGHGALGGARASGGGHGGAGADGNASGGAAGNPVGENPCLVVDPMPSPEAGAVDVPTATPINLRFSCDHATGPEQPPLVLSLSAAGHDVPGTSRYDKDPQTLQFVPDRPLALRTTYTASLLDGERTKYSWSFTTKDGTWQDSQTVTTLQGQDQNFVIGVNDLGAGIIAYSEEDPGTNFTSVTSRPFDIASGLADQTFTVTQPRYGDFHQLGVALDDQGDAAVAWLEYTGKYAVEAARQTAGQAWQPVQTVLAPANYGVEVSALAVSSNGDRLLLWRENPGNSGDGDGLRLLDLDVAQAAPLTLARSVSGSAATLIPERNGGVWAMWESPAVTVRHRSSAGVWDEARAFGKQDQPRAVLASSADGSALLVYPAYVGGKHTLATYHFTPTDGWSDSGTLDTEGDRGTSEAIYPMLAMDASGNALTIWTTRMTYVVSQNGNMTIYGSSEEVRSQRFDKASGWSAGHATPDLGVSPLSIALDDSGNGFVLDVDYNGLSAVRWLADSGFESSFPLNQSGANAGVAQLVVTRHGAGAALWRENQALVIRRFGE